MTEESQNTALSEDARKLFRGDCQFMLGVTTMAALPPPDLPEFAFAGRSNVGKSSLINRLTGRKALARTSNTPGRTRELNFFDLGGRLRLVDLPGYGYAKASRSAVESWTGLTRDFLRGRPNLRRVHILVDSRHGLKPVDEETMSLLDESAVPYQLVLTKIDKIKPTEAARRIKAVGEAIGRRPAAHPDIIATSSETGDGIAALREGMTSIAAT
ncbi:GTP-binding protein [Parvularcula bermudensis HTCC2503]|uniref:Probable GTP-binding protein EngB n=1 Tax=Parvularcula bermudensis (strain ATCC BAA-594 / HTCC2503 / KCTC 12087) TaxID=314260 RepID=E0TGR6_PARBH|nr:ribosome biogenesis GTP-binding protein YihA/YsxC [Parvularcula bermudensis]ADM10675.1 GTP-binding protein [Parvularcula bermudensis HTCC2503]